MFKLKKFTLIIKKSPKYLKKKTFKNFPFTKKSESIILCLVESDIAGMEQFFSNFLFNNLIKKIDTVK